MFDVVSDVVRADDVKILYTGCYIRAVLLYRCCRAAYLVLASPTFYLFITEKYFHQMKQVL